MGTPTSSAQDEDEAGPIPDHYIVVLNDDVPDLPAVAAEHALQHGAEIRHVYGHALRGYAARIPAPRLAGIRDDPRVRFVSQDGVAWASAQSLPTGVDRIDAEQSSRFNNSDWSVSVAVLDSGSGPHPDLNIVGGVECVSSGNNFRDRNGHGTHVAGTIGAFNDGSGVVGVAPGIPIYAVRVLNTRNKGAWSDIVCGIDWVTVNAAANRMVVANMSLGGSGSDDGNCGLTNGDAVHLAICNSTAAGVTYVVAAGNDASDFANQIPAAYDEVLTVTAMADFDGQPGAGGTPTCPSDVEDRAAGLSNYARSSDEGHTIAAPGICILSTWLREGYDTLSGTSMAAPHVTGTAALCIASGQCPGGPAGVISKLRSDAAAQPASYGFRGDPNSPASFGYFGYLVRAGIY